MIRKFSSYGPVDINQHYYAPREALIELGLQLLVGENPEQSGHYITVWAPRQRGKTWVMQQVLYRLNHESAHAHFNAVKINLEHLKLVQDVDQVVVAIAKELMQELGLSGIQVNTLADFYNIFRRTVLAKPLILILDEFDALTPAAISGIASVFRNIYNNRRDQFDQPTQEKEYLLHGVALIGVRSVLGIENATGSPFNVQRSLHIPNLTIEEAKELFRWYEQESGQRVESGVIDQLYAEVLGQPGLTSWFGELLTETYNKRQPTITPRDFEIAYAAAVNFLPNATIVNLISKAKQEPYQTLVLELFQTDEKQPFRYDDNRINFLYMHGVIDVEVVNEVEYYARFACPFVQKRLFNYFAYEFFRDVGKTHKSFENLDDTVTESTLSIYHLLRRYESYLRENRSWLFQAIPRRSDLRPYEALYHFNLYRFLTNFLDSFGVQLIPEFPTGNGKIDLLFRHANQRYGLELKTYSTRPAYHRALQQAALYGQQIHLNEIWVAFFVEEIDDNNRQTYETVYLDATTGVTVRPVFVATST
jgi:hypothetical protein